MEIVGGDKVEKVKSKPKRDRRITTMETAGDSTGNAVFKNGIFDDFEREKKFS